MYYSLGQQQASDATLKKLIASHGNESAYQIAEIYAYRGEMDKALEWLERAYQQHDAGLSYVQSDALFKGLRQNPRYLQLLRQMQIPQ